MTKKRKSIIVILHMAIILLVVSSFNIYCSYKSYEKVREAIIDSVIESNKTIYTNFQIKDNGITLAKISDTFKRENENVYSSDINLIYKDNEYFEKKYGDRDKVTYVINETINSENNVFTKEVENKHENIKAKEHFLKLASNAVTGSMKNYFVEEDGQITLKLNKNQNMLFLNFLSSSISHGANIGDGKEDYLKEYRRNIIDLFIHDNKDKIIKNIDIENTDVKVFLNDDDSLDKIEISIEINSKDSEDRTHRISIEGVVENLKVNSTISDKFK